jgi:hypothetical protein
MNQQDAMDRLAAANPVPEADVRDAASSPRALSLERTLLARPRPDAHRRPRRFLLVSGGLVAATAAVVVMVSVRAPAPTPLPAPASLAAPRTILSAAADQAQHRPSAGKFRHVTGTLARVVHVDGGGGYDLIRVDAVRSVQPANGLPGEGWLSVGEGGSSVRPLTAADAAAYARDGSPPATEIAQPSSLYPNLAGDSGFEGDLTTLPDDPAEAGAAMLGWVAGSSRAPADPQGWLFREGTKLLDTFTDVAAGADRAKIYRMLAGLTGVRTLQAGTDPLGRAALGLAYTQLTPRFGLIDWQVFLGAGTDRIMFSQAVVRRPGPANASLTPGAVQYSAAVTDVTWSDKP